MTTTAEPAPLVNLAGDPNRARTLVILVPGALTSYHAFDRYLARKQADTAIVAYRFPGVDGRPRDGNVGIAEAGRSISEYVEGLPATHVLLIGMSTGGPIVLEAARGIRRERVEAALVSTALPAPATLVSTATAAIDILAAALRAGSVRRRPVWREYYRTLLFGRGHFTDPVLATRSARMADAVVNQLILPGDGLTRAHGGDLVNWTLKRPDDLAHVRIVLLHGAADPVFSARGAMRLSKRLKGSKHLVYAAAGHLLFETEATLFDDLERVFDTWESG